MGFKIGILVMLVGIAVFGLVISDTVAYTFTAKCTHPDGGTVVGYQCETGNGNSYFSCAINDWDGNSVWSWQKNSNTAPSDSDNFNKPSPDSISGYAYNSGAINTPTSSGCTLISRYADALSGKSWWGEFGAWTMCADL